jgi:hypothetical protein
LKTVFLGLPIGASILKNIAFYFHPRGKISRVSDFTLLFGCSLCKAGIVQVSPYAEEPGAYINDFGFITPYV